MKRDQKGFTIVELLIAVAILSIVIAAVCGFIIVGSRSYAAGNSDISVQQEAQLALNQMSDVVIDTTRSVNYVGYDAGGSPVHALKDAEFAFTPEDKSLIMFNGVVEETPSAVPGGASSKTVDPGNGNKHYHFYWSKVNETLYYTELVVQPTDVDTNSIHFPAFDPADPNWVELAGHVTDFSVDLSQVEEKRVVQLALTFVDGTKEYVTSNNVTIRNKVGVNDAELDPLNKKKTLSVAARDSGVIIEPGEEYHFSTPKVTGDNVADRSVTWSLSSAGSSGTQFTDTVNGILKVATNEPGGTIDVTITTNAVDSDGNHASCTFPVYIKRVSAVNLSVDNPEGTEIDDLGETVYLVSPGCEYTIPADVQGHKLGEVCSVCADDINMDKAVGYNGNPYGNPYPWIIHDASSVPGATTQFNLNNFVDIIESEPGHAKIYVKPNAPYSTDDCEYGGVVQAMSILSTQNKAGGRTYDSWVPGAVKIKIAKGQEDAEPYGGKLQYGVETLDESIRAGLPTDYSKYVTAIRVVDNTGKEPDKVLLHFTIGGGNNLRVAPDLFDLDLNGSYTFYIQALFPIAEDRYVEGHGGTPDDNATIRDEYFSHLSKSKPYGYEGTKYRHGKVFYAKLDKPKLTYEYKGVKYRGKNITYDSVNIFTVGLGSGIVGEIRPIAYENIVEDNSVWNKIYNSLYEGKGSSQSQWNKVYYFDESVMNYQGNNTLADGSVQIDPRGSMFMKLNSYNNIEKVCGSYHIVPGMTYQNKDPGHYEIIGWQGFDFPNLPREERYYEFDDSTIHVKVTDSFTMEIKHSDFTGEVMFPLPKEMAGNPLFPNINSLDWQTTSGKLTVKAKRDTNSWAEDFTFNYVRYRYIKLENSWEVEPVRLEFRSGKDNILVHSYGIYKCGENDTKWVCTEPGSTTEKDFTIQRFDYNGGRYRADFPLPKDGDFPFNDGSSEKTYNLELYDSNMQSANNVPVFTVTYEEKEGVHEIKFRTEEGAPSWQTTNHKITIHYYGTYTWSLGQKEWTYKEGNSVDYKMNPEPNLRGLTINSTKYMMYFPKPTESSFPFKGGVTEIQCNDTYVAFAESDVYGENGRLLSWDSVKVRGNAQEITFFYDWDNKPAGTFEWQEGEGAWKKK